MPQKKSTHWGWYWKVKNKHYERKTVCENLRLVEIDSFRMYNDYRKVEWVRESENKISFEIPRYQLKAYLQDDDNLLVKHKGIPYIIPVERKPCNFGGHYFFFHCPRCKKRMRKLYCRGGYYMCRTCCNLAYYSQGVRATERFMMASRNVEEYIKRRGGNIEFDEKPSRMHKKTFEKLKSKAKYFDARSGQEHYKEIRLWYGTKIEKWLDGCFEYEWEMDVAEYRRKYVSSKQI
jgi:hypothetical protein